MIQPRISIALATYNGEKYIEELLLSLSKQILYPLEIVVTDDNSSDSTLKIIQDFSKHSPFEVRYFQNTERLGYGQNFFKAASLCKGDYVAFCDQDDFWLDNKINRISEIIELSSADFIVHGGLVVDEKLNPLDYRFPNISENGFISTKSLHNHYYPGFALTVSKNLLIKALSTKKINTNTIKSSEIAHDKVICETAFGYFNCYQITDNLVLYRQHDNNVIGFPNNSISIQNT